MKKKLKLLNFLFWYKNLKENIAKQELFLCQQVLKELHKKKEELKKEIAESYQKIEKNNILKGEEVRNFFLELQNLLEMRNKIEIEIYSKKKERERLLEILKEKYKEKKVAEILKDKVESLWIREEERRFINEMNELVLLIRASREKENT